MHQLLLSSSLPLLLTFLCETCCLVTAAATTPIMTQVGRYFHPANDSSGINIDSAEAIAVDAVNNYFFVANGGIGTVDILKFDFVDDYANIYLHKTIDMAHEMLVNYGVVLGDMPSLMYSPKGYCVVNIVPENNAVDNGWLAFIDLVAQPLNGSSNTGPNTDTDTDTAALEYELDFYFAFELVACYLPDHIAATSDGGRILIACEGEPDDNSAQFPAINPPGKIAVFDTDTYPQLYTDNTPVTLMDFTAFDAVFHLNLNRTDTQNDSSHRTGRPLATYPYRYYPSELFSVETEPEWITIDDRNEFAYVSLQESNAMAIVDLSALAITRVVSFGVEAFFADDSDRGSAENNSSRGLDASDKDGQINIQSYQHLYALRQPDSIQYYYDAANDREYILTANEGDDKHFDATRVQDLTLDAQQFLNVSHLQTDAVLGRLQVSNQAGYAYAYDDTGAATMVFTELYAFGGRGFSIFEIMDDKSALSLVYSSRSEFERYTALFSQSLAQNGADAGDVGDAGVAFNSNYDVPSFDGRSDNSGPEPESMVIGKCYSSGEDEEDDVVQEHSLVFIGCERVSGIFVYDVTNMSAPRYVQYLNNRNFSVAVEKKQRPSSDAGDIDAEQLLYMSGVNGGYPYLVAVNAISASVTMYRIDCSSLHIPDDTNKRRKKQSVEITLVSKIMFGFVGFALLLAFAACMYCLCCAIRKRRRSKQQLLDHNGSVDDYVQLTEN